MIELIAEHYIARTILRKFWGQDGGGSQKRGRWSSTFSEVLDTYGVELLYLLHDELCLVDLDY
jgi:hypothetical protein